MTGAQNESRKLQSAKELQPQGKLRVAVLGSESNSYVRSFRECCQQQVVHCDVISWTSLSAELSNQDSCSHSLQEYSCVLVRSMPLGSLEQVIFRMDCLQVAQDTGVRVLNSPRCLEVSIDKWLTLHRLQQAGLAVPPTLACQTRDQAFEAWEKLGRDVVVKPLFGGEGRGIVRVENTDMAWRVFSTLHQLDSVLYLQKYLPNFGYDIRVLILGDRLFAVKRHSPKGIWKTNISQGACPEPHALSPTERELALKAAEAVAQDDSSFRFLGVDLMPTQDNQIQVLEVNAVPGWHGLAGALGVDVAGELMRFMIEHHNHE
ncbi:MAG: RimK family alpha-L-glutamate ligase [Planctomycetota bacterium]